LFIQRRFAQASLNVFPGGAVARGRAGILGEQAAVALLLALVGGLVDGVGYVLLAHLFTAHMSGNSIAMAVHAGEGSWHQAFHRAFPIPLFFLGVIFGAALSEMLVRRGVRSSFAASLGLEALLLTLFMVYGKSALHGTGFEPATGSLFYLLAALPALAIGLQNATLRRVGGSGVRTTYITGMLTNAGEELVVYLYWLRDRLRPGRRWLLLRLTPRQAPFQRMLLHLGLWFCYVGGAVGGVLSKQRWEMLCLLPPIFCLFLIAGVDLVWPIGGVRDRIAAAQKS
jgi:uncharacterized membrane protein YoaK (UPF0700 family)